MRHGNLSPFLSFPFLSSYPNWIPLLWLSAFRVDGCESHTYIVYTYVVCTDHGVLC